jgi:hypothetical protein
MSASAPAWYGSLCELRPHALYTWNAIVARTMSSVNLLDGRRSCTWVCGGGGFGLLPCRRCLISFGYRTKILSLGFGVGRHCLFGLAPCDDCLGNIQACKAGLTQKPRGFFLSRGCLDLVFELHGGLEVPLPTGRHLWTLVHIWDHVECISGITWNTPTWRA